LFEGVLESIRVQCVRNHSTEHRLYFSSGWIWRIGPYFAMAAWMAARVRGSAILNIQTKTAYRSEERNKDGNY